MRVRIRGWVSVMVRVRVSVMVRVRVRVRVMVRVRVKTTNGRSFLARLTIDPSEKPPA